MIKNYEKSYSCCFVINGKNYWLNTMKMGVINNWITKNKTIFLCQEKRQGKKASLEWIMDMLTEFWIFELSESKRTWNNSGCNLALYTLFLHENQQKLTSGELFLFLNNGSVSEFSYFVLFEVDIIYFARRVYHISEVVANIMYLTFIHENSFSRSGIGEG